MQFQMLFRRMGMPSQIIGDQNLISSLYKAFDKNGDKNISWREFQRVMNIFASDDIDSQLDCMYY